MINNFYCFKITFEMICMCCISVRDTLNFLFYDVHSCKHILIKITSSRKIKNKWLFCALV